jgi:AraC-like DNA-binding protein
MSTHIYVPPAPLSDFVDILWLSEQYAPPHPQERLMPSGMMNLVVTWDANGRFWSGVSGVRTQAMMLYTSAPFTVFGVSFKPGGAFPFLSMPAGELQDLHVPLEAVWGRRANDVCESLVAACTAARKFQIVECALLETARGRFARHRAVRYAVRALGDASRPRPVAQIVDDVGMSQRRFIETFRNHVGVTPKAFARLRRFQHVLGAVEHLSEVDWAGVAVSCGYFDQAHFIHDFKEFAGVTPSIYFRFRTSRNHIAVHD